MLLGIILLSSKRGSISNMPSSMNDSKSNYVEGKDSEKREYILYIPSI